MRACFNSEDVPERTLTLLTGCRGTVNLKVVAPTGNRPPGLDKNIGPETRRAIRPEYRGIDGQSVRLYTRSASRNERKLDVVGKCCDRAGLPSLRFISNFEGS